MTKTIILCFGLLAAASVAAQQYKWIDQDGKVRYGDVPPPGVNATRLKPPAGGAAPTPATSAAAKKDAKKTLTPEEAFQKRQKEQREAEEKLAKDRAGSDEKRAGCERAQAALRQLQSGQRITTTDAKGERVFIEDEQRNAEIARAQRSVSEWCK